MARILTLAVAIVAIAFLALAIVHSAQHIALHDIRAITTGPVVDTNPYSIW